MTDADVYDAEYRKINSEIRIDTRWKYLIGVYREMWMEYLASRGVDHVKSLRDEEHIWYIPSSLSMMRTLLVMDTPDHMLEAAERDIIVQYNAGRRAC